MLDLILGTTLMMVLGAEPAVIAEADVVVGDVTHIKLMADLLKGKDAVRAEHAARGGRVNARYFAPRFHSTPPVCGPETLIDPTGMHEIIKPRIGDHKRHLLFDSLGDKFKAAGLHEGELRVKRSRVSCFAACKSGPVMCVQPDGTWYCNVTDANMDRIIDQHLVGGQVVQDLVFHQGPGGTDAE